MTDENDDLRQLFDEATSDIRPQGTYDDIRSRTEKVDPMARRWFLPVIAAAAVMALAIGGTMYLLRDNDDPRSPAPAGPPSDGTMSGPLLPYFVGDTTAGPRLFRDRSLEQLECPESTQCLLVNDVSRAIKGEVTDQDYRSPWPTGSDASTTYADHLVTVDLHGPDLADRPTGMDAETARIAIQQVVYSAQRVFRSLEDGEDPQALLPVRFLIDGKVTPTVLGEPTADPVTGAPKDDVFAPVQIDSPYEGASLPPGDLKVEGVAATFEANVVWELLVGGDAVVDSGFTTARECCTLAPYSFTIKNLQPGSYTLVVHDTDESGQGRPVNQDTKEIIVQ